MNKLLFIGRSTACILFKSLGLDVLVSDDIDVFKKALYKALKEDYGIIYVDGNLYNAVYDNLDQIYFKDSVVITPLFLNGQGSETYLENRRKAIGKAIGIVINEQEQIKDKDRNLF